MPLFIVCLIFITAVSGLYFVLPTVQPFVQGMLAKQQARYRCWSRELFWGWSENRIRQMVWMEYGALVLAFLVFRGLSGSWLLAALLTFVASYVPIWLYNRAKSQRHKAITQDLPEASQMVIQHLRANRSLEKAIELTSQALRARPVGQEFGLIVKNVQGNLSMEEALKSARNNIGTEAFTMMTTAFLFASQKGNGLKILDDVAHTINELNRVEQKVYTEVSGVRVQKKYISWMLPICLGVVCLFDGVSSILFHSTTGFVFLTISFGLWQGSIFLMNRILKSVL